MKTNTLMALCTCMLGALLTFIAVAAFGSTPAVQAQDGGDDNKNTSSQGGDFKALTLLTGSDTEVLVVLKEVPNEHPYLVKDYPTALQMAVYAVKTNGGKSGDIHFIGTRQLNGDISIPQARKMKGTETIDDINQMLIDYRAKIAKNNKKKR